VKEKDFFMDIDDKTTISHSEEERIVSEEERAYIKKMIERLMEKGFFVVYGDEADEEKNVLFDPGGRKELCKAICCSFVFALTKKEVDKGIIKWNPKRPYFIARDEDGYCPHLDRKSLLCKIWKDRPERCRKYDCRKDQNVWIDWKGKVLNKDLFKHLPK
jgi:hypothetical protein